MSSRTNGKFPWERQKKMKAAGYARDLEATRDLPYAEKFDGFFRLREQAKNGEFQIVVAAFPGVLGDNYEELVSNLWRCAKVGLLVAFTEKEGDRHFLQERPPTTRTRPPSPGSLPPNIPPSATNPTPTWVGSRDRALGDPEDLLGANGVSGGCGRRVGCWPRPRVSR